MIVVGLTGVARSGKDTVGKILVDELGFERRGFADKLRAVALGADPLIPMSHDPSSAYTNERLSSVVKRRGWEGAKEIAEVRRFLQRLGTEGVRENLGFDAWVNAAMSDLDPDGRYVFTDVRFENEARAIRDFIPFDRVQCAEVWRVERPGFEALNAHASEAGIPPELISRVITNDGTLGQLKAKVLNGWSLA